MTFEISQLRPLRRLNLEYFDVLIDTFERVYTQVSPEFSDMAALYTSQRALTPHTHSRQI